MSAPPPAPAAKSIGVSYVDQKPTCWRCGRVLLAYAARPWAVRCKRCKATNQSVSAPHQT